MIKQLRVKFMLVNMAIVTAMLCVIFTLVILFMGSSMEEESRRMMSQIEEMALQRGPIHDRHEHPDWRQDMGRSYFLVDVTLETPLILARNGYYETLEDSELLSLTEKALAQGRNNGTLREQQLRYKVNQARERKMVVFADVSSEINTLKNLVMSCVFIGLLSFLVFFLISWLLARWAIHPVEKAWNQQRQFVADASHELKTPLTVIMTNAELLQSAEYEEEEKRRFAGSILTMSHQMRGLVESLLELARVDNGTAKMSFASMDLSELAADALLPFEPVYFEKELQLESSLEEKVFVRGSSAHLKQVVDILLDNAAKYSFPQGTVTLRLRRQGSQCLLSVSNTGEAISREDLTNIFKRFYRIDKARAMNHSYGLGLAIADSIVKEHGGKIWAESEGGVNTFCVQLPLVSQL